MEQGQGDRSDEEPDSEQSTTVQLGRDSPEIGISHSHRCAKNNTS